MKKASSALSGRRRVSLVFKNVPASQVVYGYLEQTAGGAWNCYSVRASFPSLVLDA